MNEVTAILSAAARGDSGTSEQLLPLVYDELKKLAAHRLAQEKPGQTLQATALVHEAYLRLVDADQAKEWNNRGHFFAAALRPCAGFSSITPATREASVAVEEGTVRAAGLG
jgi:hypothetical protein